MNRRQRKTVKMVTGMMGLCIVGYVVGPPVLWHLGEGLAATLHSPCHPCMCDCYTQPLLAIPEELGNQSFLECMKHDKEMSMNEERSSTELLAEELRLKEAQAQEDRSRADRALLEAKKVASQYQKEAEKCNMGMETCEEAREKVEEALWAQRSKSALWELRARQRGWEES